LSGGFAGSAYRLRLVLASGGRSANPRIGGSADQRVESAPETRATTAAFDVAEDLVAGTEPEPAPTAEELRS
jgi:hypothetical protein